MPPPWDHSLAPTGDTPLAACRPRPRSSPWTSLALLLLPWLVTVQAVAAGLRVSPDPGTGQIDVRDGDLPVLRYNVRLVEPGAVLDQVAPGNRIYARARTDYLHPLHGLRGEILTRDWSLDHPHHRGIYWAWPEVDFGTERGDLHALQRVFAGPTGEPRCRSTEDFAEIEADHHWRWEDQEPIVQERVLLRVHRATGRGRAIDLAFRFAGLREGVTVARRETRLYGGLNLRLATPAQQAITTHTDDPAAVPRRAWSDLTGVFREPTPSGLTLFQHRDNPEYPGDWVQYPELSWVQPTFPTAGTRYPLSPGRPLLLRYRLWIHDGPAPTPDEASALWDAYHATPAPTPTPFGEGHSPAHP